jgi:hypothetical protein
VISIVIPAHDEERVIGRCLSGLASGAEPGELEVVVVANGCTDGTAAAARTFPGVRVVETPVAGKAAALNLGDEHAPAFPGSTSTPTSSWGSTPSAPSATPSTGATCSPPPPGPS